MLTELFIFDNLKILATSHAHNKYILITQDLRFNNAMERYFVIHYSLKQLNLTHYISGKERRGQQSCRKLRVYPPELVVQTRVGSKSGTQVRTSGGLEKQGTGRRTVQEEGSRG